MSYGDRVGALCGREGSRKWKDIGGASDAIVEVVTEQGVVRGDVKSSAALSSPMTYVTFTRMEVLFISK